MPRATPVPVATPDPFNPHAIGYRRAIAELDRHRIDIATRLAGAPTEQAREAIVREAREYLLGEITRSLIPAWIGTRWNFHGTSETPGQGSIACGYFVATILRDAGFAVDRVPLAQKGSADIVRTLVPDAQVHSEFGATPHEAVVAARAAAGDGLYVVGLDNHVAFLVVDGSASGAQLCHSSNRSPKSVRCESAVASRSMVSRVHVMGPVLTDEAILAWIEGRALD